MKEFLLMPEYRLLFCFLLLGLCLLVTIDTVIFYSESIKNKRRAEADLYDEKGNHRYYERSLIKKENFIAENPGVGKSEIRSFRRFLKDFISHT